MAFVDLAIQHRPRSGTESSTLTHSSSGVSDVGTDIIEEALLLQEHDGEPTLVVQPIDVDQEDNVDINREFKRDAVRSPIACAKQTRPQRKIANRLLLFSSCLQTAYWAMMTFLVAQFIRIIDSEVQAGSSSLGASRTAAVLWATYGVLAVTATLGGEHLLQWLLAKRDGRKTKRC